jgi:putative membrane protein
MSYAAAVGPSGWSLVAMTVLVGLFIGLSVAGYALLSRGRRTARRAARSAAQRLLDDRFARGEIDEQEYLHLAAELTEARPSKGRRPHPPAADRHPSR